MLEEEYLALKDSVMDPCSGVVAGGPVGRWATAPLTRDLEGALKSLRGAKLVLKQTAYEVYEVLQKRAQTHCVLIIAAEFTFYTPANALIAFRIGWYFSWVPT